MDDSSGSSGSSSASTSGSGLYDDNDIREEILNYLETYKSDESKYIEIANFTPKYSAEYYDAKVLMEAGDGALSLFRPTLEEVINEEQTDLWMYFKIATSSIATSKNPGRNIRFLVKDDTTQKYIGIIAIGSDIYQCSVRDAEIGWNHENHRKHIDNVVNIWCCVSLQPIGFNTNIGKLLCSLCFSKEIFETYKRKYGIEIAAITTFGINGRAVQYECLPVIKFIGYTKGYGTNHMPNHLFNEASSILKEKGIEISGNNKIKRWKTIMRYYNIPDIKLKHGILRGVYIGYIGAQAKAFLQGGERSETGPLKTVAEITEWWKTRWAINRLRNLKKNGKYKLAATGGRPDWTFDLFQVCEEKVATNAPQPDAQIHVALTKEIIAALPELSPSYIAGLMDGDGCIMFNKAGAIMPQIELAQCDPYVVFALQKQYKCGQVRIVAAKTANSRQQFKITIYGCRELLLCLKDHCIIKQRRAEICFRLFEELSSGRGDDSGAGYNTETVKQLFADYDNALKSYEPESDAIYSRINNEYVAGLFDAEGCITFKKYERTNSVTVTITQRSSPTILRKINEFYRINGSLTIQRLNLYSFEKCTLLLNSIEPYVILKKDQISGFNEVVEYRKNRKKYDCDKIAQLKRKIYIPDDYLIIDLNDKYKIVKRADERNLKPLYKENILVARKRPVSRRLAAAGDRGADVYDSAEHHTNIALAVIAKRRNISDEIIYAVREKLEGKVMQKTICEEMGLQRHIVHNIARGKLLPLDTDIRDQIKDKIITKRANRQRRQEMTPETAKKYDAETVAISKRVYSMSQALQIMKYAIEHRETITQTALAAKSQELLGVKLSVTQIHGLVSGRVCIYERELATAGADAYREYKVLCDEIAKIDFKANGRRQFAINNRAVDGETIIRVLREYNRGGRVLTHKDIAAAVGGDDGDVTADQVRGILRGTTKMMPFEFPCGGITWDEYLELRRA